jgi:hypothetical protein
MNSGGLVAPTPVTTERVLCCSLGLRLMPVKTEIQLTQLGLTFLSSRVLICAMPQERGFWSRLTMTPASVGEWAIGLVIVQCWCWQASAWPWHVRLIVVVLTPLLSVCCSSFGGASDWLRLTSSLCVLLSVR